MAQEAGSTNSTMSSAEAQDHDRSIFSLRSRRQFGIFAAGSAFMLISAGITRRAITRRNNWTRPLYFYHNDQAPVTPINGPLEALEALSVASINAVSFVMMLTGGFVWAFDIGSVAELRQRTKARLGYEKAIEAEKGTEGLTQEQWITSVLSAEDEKKKNETKR